MEASGLSSASDELILRLRTFKVLLMSYEMISSGQAKLSPRQATLSYRLLMFYYSKI